MKRPKGINRLSKKAPSLTDEDDQQQTDGSQLDVGVTEGVAEGGVDDHEEDGAAHSAKRRFAPLQKLPRKTPAHLQMRRRQVLWRQRSDANAHPMDTNRPT